MDPMTVRQTLPATKTAPSTRPAPLAGPRAAVLLLLGLGLGLGLGAPAVQAEIFKYEDLDGNLIYSDRPMKGAYKLLARFGSEAPAAPATETAALPARLPIPDPPKGRYELRWAWEAPGNWGYDSFLPQPSPKAWAKYNENVERFTPMIEAVARLNQLQPELLHAVIRAESSYNPNAVSRAGAVGLMQLMPATAQRFGVLDRTDPAANLRGGAQYLRELLELFDYDLHLALAGYNAGENAVIRAGRRIPNYPETQQYVAKVLAYYGENRLQKLSLND
jgi:soluble lytic murein transglycosylase-like protein